jgi:hypothetical protein
VYSSDDGGSHSNQSEYLDGADKKEKSSIHPRRRSEGSFHTHAQEEDLDSDAADEESCASKEQQEGPPSSRQGTNKMRRRHSILSPNPFERIGASEDNGERSSASPLQAPHYRDPTTSIPTSFYIGFHKR